MPSTAWTMRGGRYWSKLHSNAYACSLAPSKAMTPVHSFSSDTSYSILPTIQACTSLLDREDKGPFEAQSPI